MLKIDRERRMHKRIAFSSLICIVDGSREEVKLSSDISYGGLFFFSGSKIMIGKKVSIFLSIPGCSPLQLEGEIRWEKSINNNVVGYGIKFGLLTGEEIESISFLLEDSFERTETGCQPMIGGLSSEGRGAMGHRRTNKPNMDGK